MIPTDWLARWQLKEQQVKKKASGPLANFSCSSAMVVYSYECVFGFAALNKCKIIRLLVGLLGIICWNRSSQGTPSTYLAFSPSPTVTVEIVIKPLKICSMLHYYPLFLNQQPFWGRLESIGFTLFSYVRHSRHITDPKGSVL